MIDEITAIPLGFMIGLIFSFLIGIPLLNRWLDHIDKTHCKFCSSNKLKQFAGIGADGIMCMECKKTQ